MEKRACCPCQKRAENAMIKITKYCLLPWHSWDVSLNVILQGWSSVVCFVQDNLSLPKVLTTSLSPPTVKDQVSKKMSLEDNISNLKKKKRNRRLKSNVVSIAFKFFSVAETLLCGVTDNWLATSPSSNWCFVCECCSVTLVLGFSRCLENNSHIFLSSIRWCRSSLTWTCWAVFPESEREALEILILIIKC